MKDSSEKIIKVAKLVSYNFLSVLLSKDSLIKLGDFYTNVESRKLAREWFALQFYLMIWAISSFYKEDPMGIDISKGFRFYVIDGLTEAGVYVSIEDAQDFIKSRTNTYEKVIATKQDNPLMKVSIQFLKYIEQEDTELLIRTGEQIVTTLQANMKLIKEATPIE